MHDSDHTDPARPLVERHLREELEQSLACEMVLWAFGDPDALHDYRVAHRRARVLVREYVDVLPAGARSLRHDLKWIARRTGTVRDLDLLLEHLEEHGFETRYEELTADVERKRRKEFARLLVRLGSKRSRAAIERWRQLGGTPDTAVGQVERDRFAALTREQLAGRYERLAQAMEAVTLDPDDRGIHRVRIAAKSVRYLLEFLQDARPSADAAAMIDRLKSLQDRLGAHQDLVSHERLARALDGQAAGLSDMLASDLERSRPGVIRAMKAFTGSDTARRIERLTRPRG